MSDPGNDGDSELTVVANASSDVACSKTTFKWKGGTPPYFMSLQNEQIGIEFPNTTATNFTANIIFASGSNVTAKLSDSGGTFIGNEIDFPVFQVKDGGDHSCELVYIHQNNTHLPPDGDTSESNAPAFDAANPVDFHSLVSCQTFPILWQGGGEPLLLDLRTPDNVTIVSFDGLRGKNFTTSLPFPTGTQFIIRLDDLQDLTIAGPFTVQPGGTTDCLPAPLPEQKKISGPDPSSSSSSLATSNAVSQASSSSPSSSSPASAIHDQSTTISGAAIGGIVAGIAALVCLGIIVLIWIRRRRRRRRYLETDLLQPGSINPFTHNDQVMGQVEPFGVSDGSSSDHLSNQYGSSSLRLISGISKGKQASDPSPVEPMSSSSPGSSSRSRSGGRSPSEQGPLYHRDAGPVREEIPPSYADIQQSR